jgi:hypothetical protein
MLRQGDKVLLGVWSVGQGRTDGSPATPQNNVMRMGDRWNRKTLVSFRIFLAVVLMEGYGLTLTQRSPPTVGIATPPVVHPNRPR